jgi:hypothetical protein
MEINQVGNYGCFSNVKIVEINDKTVVIEDKQGNQKEVYKDLFLKHFTPSSSNSDYAKCPCCGEPWNIEEHDYCQCGAFIKKRL